MSVILIVENIVLANLETNFEHLVDYGAKVVGTSHRHMFPCALLP